MERMFQDATSFNQSLNNVLVSFAPLAFRAHSKAQGVVARAYANAQRGVVGTPDDVRELDEAQRVVRSTDRAVRDGVRQQLRTV